MPMAECFPSAFVAVVFERLTSRELLNFARKEGIDSKLTKWRKTLIKIQAVLSDAEEKQIVNEAVKMWLNDLQDLAYDLDDLLDEFYTQALRRKVMAARPRAKVLKVIISTWTANFSTHGINFARKIDDISSRLEKIWRLKNVLDLNENCGWRGIKPYETMKRFRTTTYLLDETRVYGREVAKDAILELLSRGDDEASVIPIVGMGGVGKTTLAQLVYKDDKLKSMGFELKAWVCVSDDFDVVALTKLMLESLTSEACTLNDLNSLQVKLRDNLFGKKYLFVLDDIWNENYQDWDCLSRPLLAGARGSKVIVTTRNQSVAKIVGTIPAYRLEELGEEDSLQLLAQHALGTSNFDQHQNLKEIGRSIVNKCKGLPLALKTLGGVLRTSEHQNDWQDLLNSKIWELPQEKSYILPALRLSYHHLHPCLKQCFAYCSIFPKDYEFDRHELILLWMAVGLLQKSEGRSVEDFGGEYFDHLLSRSFFQHSGHNALRFVMHDCMSDLAQFVAGEICFRLEDKSEGKLSERTRHLSYNHKEFEAFQKHKDFYKVQQFQTFLLFPIYPNHLYDYDLSTKVLVDLLSRLQYVKVLSLSGYFMRELPSAIGELKHLRYLNLSHTSIKCLPDSVCTLYNLQTLSLHGCRPLCELPKSIGYLVNLCNLNLSRTSVKCLPDSVCTLYNLETLSLDGCRSLCELPTSIGDLVNLRHLGNANTEELREMPSGIGKVTNLHTLPKIGLGKSSGLKLQELKDLKFLRGTLSIVGLQNVLNIDDAKEASLSCKHYLDELGLIWCCTFDDSRDEKLEMDVLDMLRPQIMLKRLEIEFYGGMKFPSWIGDPSFFKIVKVSLIDCRKCTSLPPLGQLPMLKYLSIGGLHEVRRVGVEFYRDGCPLEFQSFVSLETLSFENMPEWEEWSDFIGGREVGGQFPRLSKLTIRSCPKLTRIPLLQLISLRNLYLEECPGVVLKRFADLTSLITLKIVRVTDLTCLHEEFLLFSLALEDMEVSGCNELVSLWQNGPVTLENHVRLKELRVLNCPRLVSLGEEEQGLPPNLEILRLSRCDNLEKLPNGLNSRTSLRKFIIDCPKLMSFPGGVFR